MYSTYFEIIHDKANVNVNMPSIIDFLIKTLLKMYFLAYYKYRLHKIQTRIFL